jgi:hypothetical protein
MEELQIPTAANVTLAHKLFYFNQTLAHKLSKLISSHIQRAKSDFSNDIYKMLQEKSVS